MKWRTVSRAIALGSVFAITLFTATTESGGGWRVERVVEELTAVN